MRIVPEMIQAIPETVRRSSCMKSEKEILVAYHMLEGAVELAMLAHDGVTAQNYDKLAAVLAWCLNTPHSEGAEYLQRTLVKVSNDTSKWVRSSNEEKKGDTENENS